MSARRECPTAWLVSGERLLRECLIELVRHKLTVCRNFDSVEEAYGQAACESAPDLLIFLAWPQDAGTAGSTFDRLRKTMPDSRSVLLLSSNADRSVLGSALAAGVHGVLQSDTSLEVLIQSLNVILMGGSISSTRLASSVLGSLSSHAREAATECAALTTRQAGILAEIMAGHSNKEIGRHRDLSEAAVKVQVRTILKKIGVENRTQAAVWARNHGVPGISDTMPAGL